MHRFQSCLHEANSRHCYAGDWTNPLNFSGLLRFSWDIIFRRVGWVKATIREACFNVFALVVVHEPLGDQRTLKHR